MDLDETINAKIEAMQKAYIIKDKTAPTKKTKADKPKKKRPRSWKTIKGLALSKKNPPNQAYWLRVWNMHESGMSDAEINAKLKAEKEAKK